jgi:hypothetical protein
MPFSKGHSVGRPKGTLNRVTIEIRDAARAIVDDPVYRAGLLTRLLNGEAPHMETLMWHYAYGKPKETIEVSAPDTFAGLSQAELAEQAEAIARELRAAADAEAQRQLTDGSTIDAVVIEQEAQ